MFLGEDFWEISLPHNISCKLKIPGGTTMRKKNYKGRCEKKSVQKCNEIFKAYDAVQSAYVDVLSSRDDIIEIRCNVPLEDMEYTSDLQLADGIVKEDLYTAYYAVSENEEIVADREIEILGMEEETVVEKDVAVEQGMNVEVMNPDNNQNEIGRQKEQADSVRKQRTDLDGIGK